MDLADKRILITGGHGFVGKHAVNEFRRRGCTKIIAPTHAACDLTVMGEVQQLLADFKPEIVVHLAARVGGIGANRQYPGTFFFQNALMGLNIIEACRVAKVAKVVAVGSICSYPKMTPVPFQESEYWNGYPEETNAPYGIAKKMMVTQIQAYAAEFGMNGINLLPVNLYGPGDHFEENRSHVIPALIHRFEKARRSKAPEVEVWGTGSATREFMYVTDAARAIVLATEHLETVEPINIGTGQEIAIADLVWIIADQVGYAGKIRFNPEYPDGQPRRCLDVTKAAELFGFRAEIGLNEGIERTIAWYRAECSTL